MRNILLIYVTFIEFVFILDVSQNLRYSSPIALQMVLFVPLYDIKDPILSYRNFGAKFRWTGVFNTGPESSPKSKTRLRSHGPFIREIPLKCRKIIRALVGSSGKDSHQWCTGTVQQQFSFFPEHLRRLRFPLRARIIACAE